ncbi:MAG: 2-oxoglutarate dehydrogenase complex dihydrolipoyllysine-residue succinyltransferase [Alphaproteobacteria bacterium]|nr:2-oxoglutarate dehydrogenase complex dihydrolipoyllysine-residue succinyltransferase [Alphaproteobacteria bacterium]
MAIQIMVPTLGESVTEATVAKWLKQVGDTVSADEPLVELETDKVSLEVPAPAAGVLTEILVADGVDVEVGAVLGSVDESGAAATPAPETPAPAPAAAPATVAPVAAAPVPAPKTNGGALVEVVVPAVGESVTEGTIAKWLKQVGEAVAVDEPLVELETDKASVEIPSTVAGALAEIRVAEGEDVEVGTVIAMIAEGATSSPAAAAAPPEAPAAAAEPSGALSPAVRKLIDDNGLDPAQIPATGAKGQLTKGDVLKFIESRSKPAPAAPQPAAPAARPAVSIPAAPVPAGELPPRPEDPRGEERVRMSRLRQRIAQRLKEAQNNAAMLTTYNEVRMDALMKLRTEYRDVFEKKHGVRLGFLSFFIKAAIIALKEIPAVNAEIYGDEIVYKNYYDIGVAVGTPQGLVVPVVRDADQMSFAEIEGTIAEYGRRARDGKLGVQEMSGGTFTISNGGVYGSLMSMPILNPPQSGILGMHKIQKRPIVEGNEITVASMMYLAMSYDHRIVDGREAVTFLVRMKEVLEDPQRLLIDV